MTSHQEETWWRSQQVPPLSSSPHQPSLLRYMWGCRSVALDQIAPLLLGSCCLRYMPPPAAVGSGGPYSLPSQSFTREQLAAFACRAVASLVIPCLLFAFPPSLPHWPLLWLLWGFPSQKEHLLPSFALGSFLGNLDARSLQQPFN